MHVCSWLIEATSPEYLDAANAITSRHREDLHNKPLWRLWLPASASLMLWPGLSKDCLKSIYIFLCGTVQRRAAVNPIGVSERALFFTVNMINGFEWQSWWFMLSKAQSKNSLLVKVTKLNTLTQTEAFLYCINWNWNFIVLGKRNVTSRKYYSEQEFGERSWISADQREPG